MTDTADAPDRVSPPRTIVLAFTALIANVVISVLNAALLWGFQDYLRRQLVKSNNKLKPTDKHFKKDYNLQAGFDKVNHDLHSGLTVGLVQTAIFGLLLVLLAVNFRRGKGWARWATVLVLLLVVQAPFRLLNLGGDAPIAIRLGSALVGLTGLAVIVLLFLPESSRFFAATRGVRAGGDPRAAAPMGLRNLFMPRPRTTVEPDARPVIKPDASSAKRPSASESPARSGEKRAKAKARAGVDAAPPTPATKPTGAASAKNRGKSRKGS